MRDISNKYPVLVHRDLKPENIFVNFNKETKKWDIYIIDFGCANQALRETPGMVSMMTTYLLSLVSSQ